MPYHHISDTQRLQCHTHYNAAGYRTVGLQYGNTTASYTLLSLHGTCNCNTITLVNTASAACWSTSNKSKLIAIIQFAGLAVLVQKLSLRSNQFSRASIRTGPWRIWSSSANKPTQKRRTAVSHESFDHVNEIMMYPKGNKFLIDIFPSRYYLTNYFSCFTVWCSIVYCKIVICSLVLILTM